jgi:hypothetical protein
MALDRLTKLSLNETYTKDRIGKHLCDVFAIQNGLKQGHALSPLLFNFASEYALKKKTRQHSSLLTIHYHLLAVGVLQGARRGSREPLVNLWLIMQPFVIGTESII